MSKSTLFARLALRAAQLPACPSYPRLPVTSMYTSKQNFISVVMYDDNDRPTEKEEKEEIEDAEFDVAEFGSDPYPYYRKEHLKRKEDRFEGARRKKGAVSIRKVRGLVELINFKRDNCYQ